MRGRLTLFHHLLAIEDIDSMFGRAIQTATIEAIDDICLCSTWSESERSHKSFRAKHGGDTAYGGRNLSGEIEFLAIYLTRNLDLGICHQSGTLPLHLAVVARHDSSLDVASKLDDVVFDCVRDILQFDVADGEIEK